MQNHLLRIKSIAIIIFSSTICILAQNTDFDKHLIINSHTEKHETHVRELMNLKNKSFFIRYNPVSYLAIGSMYVYQNLLSKHLNATCIYSPSCSEFSKKIIEKEGFIIGILASADRLMRCNRLSIRDIPAFRPYKNGRILEPISFYKQNDQE